MKQTYIKPQMTVIEIDSECMLNSSPGPISGSEGNVNNAPSYRRRKSSIWEDEESDF